MTQANLDLSAVAAACGADLIVAKSHDDKAAASRESANKHIAALHKAKATVGRKGTCSIATAFYDALIAGGLSKGTANNYLSVFRDAVKSGKPVTDWNPNRKGGKGGKGGKGKKKAELAAIINKARNHKDFAEFCEVIESEYNDDKGDIATIIKSWLEAMGVEISE